MAEQPDSALAGMRQYIGGFALPQTSDGVPADSVLGAPVTVSASPALLLVGVLVWLMLRKG